MLISTHINLFLHVAKAVGMSVREGLVPEISVTHASGRCQVEPTCSMKYGAMHFYTWGMPEDVYNNFYKFAFDWYLHTT